VRAGARGRVGAVVGVALADGIFVAVTDGVSAAVADAVSVAVADVPNVGGKVGEARAVTEADRCPAADEPGKTPQAACAPDTTRTATTIPERAIDRRCRLNNVNPFPAGRALAVVLGDDGSPSGQQRPWLDSV
jgi:hypothetical protein